jgi:hypothetical protein
MWRLAQGWSSKPTSARSNAAYGALEQAGGAVARERLRAATGSLTSSIPACCFNLTQRSRRPRSAGTGERQSEFLTHPFAAGESTQESAIQLAGTSSVSKNVLPCWSINRGCGKRIGPLRHRCPTEATTTAESMCLQDYRLIMIFFTNVNAILHQKVQIADTEQVDVVSARGSFGYPHSSRLGVTCHPSAAAKQRFLKTQTRPSPAGVHRSTKRHPVRPAPDLHNDPRFAALLKKLNLPN